jgi:hypothetical protein
LLDKRAQHDAAGRASSNEERLVAPGEHPEHRLRLSVEQAREPVRLLLNLLDARP